MKTLRFLSYRIRTEIFSSNEIAEDMKSLNIGKALGIVIIPTKVLKDSP